MRLDMLTSDWHRLLRPVLPHASTDKDSWSLQAVRLELGPLLQALTRPKGRTLDGLDMRGDVLSRWKDAARGTERLRVWTGPERGDTLLLTVERHFAGIQGTDLMLDDPSRERSALPWAAELLPAGIADGG
jgi:hypothetical protein